MSARKVVRRRLAAVLGAVALALLGVVLTVSFDDAAANGASYLKAVGITGVPPFLRTALAGTVFTIVLTAILTAVVTSRFVQWREKRKPVEAEAPSGKSDYDLYISMASLTNRMRDYLKYEGFDVLGGDPNDILADCRSLNLTLFKQGFAVPYVHSGTARSMFDVFGRYYTMLGPLLRDGHREQAIAVAQSYAADHPPPADLL